jgi:hypothetical protein
LRGLRRGFEKGRCPLCREEENVTHILKCLERKMWREIFSCSKWLNINEDMTYKRVINCTNVRDLKNM